MRFRNSQVRKGSGLNNSEPCRSCLGWCSNCRYLLCSRGDTLPGNLYSGLRRGHGRARRDREGASREKGSGVRGVSGGRGRKTGNAIKGGWVRQGRITGWREAAQGMRERRRKEATRNAALRTSDHVQWQNYASTVETRFVTKVPSGSSRRRADGHTV